MAGTVVIGCAEQSLAYELRAQLAEIGDLEVVALADSTHELTNLVLTHQPNVVLAHDQLGPQPVHEVVRDLGMRRPSTVSVVVSSDPDPESLSAAMDAGARGVLTYPLTFEDVRQRVTAAVDWSRHMEHLLVATEQGDTSARGRALVVAMTGSKGGVGTTSILTHLAWDLRRQSPDLTVAVVDLDLEKGDVTSYLAASYRTSVADLAKVSEDLSLSTVADALIAHESGLHLLLPPEDVREVEWVTPASVRAILSLLRQQYDLVLVDAGSHVTPVQAAVVEVADEVVQVVTPDLVSLRGLRRNVAWWESLGVAKPESVKVLLNRTTRSDELQEAAIQQLSTSPVLGTSVPHQVRRLESALNSRAPQLVEGDEWWARLRALVPELRLDRALAARQADAEQPEQGERAATSKRRRRRGDRGQATVEMLGALPIVVLLIVVLLQLAVAGLTFVFAGYSASGAARAASLDPTNMAHVRSVADDRFPDVIQEDLDVDVTSITDRSVGVRLSVEVPTLVSTVLGRTWHVTVDRKVVSEV